MNRIIKLIGLSILLSQISACDLVDENASVSVPEESQNQLAVPTALSDAISASIAGAHVAAFVITDEGSANETEAEMNFNATRTKVTLTIPNLPTGNHSFSIVYRYDTQDNIIKIVDIFKTGNIAMTLQAGNNPMSSADLLILNNPTEVDDNNDGQFNLAAIIANEDPRRCVLGSAQLENLAATPPVKGCRLVAGAVI